MKDNIASWELWYNETVRNWIKIVDRLPGSHSESVEYLISNYSGIPDRPQFVTESSSLGIDTYQIEWGQFGRAESYVLVENGIEIYNGSETNFVFVEKPDGTYSYTVTAKLPSGSLVASESITIDIDYVVQPPRLKLPYAQNLTDNDELMVEWTKSPYAVWYSLYHAKSDGIMIEIYNGSATSFLVEDLSEGQNRFRVGAGIADGKYSELSESSYVNYSPASEDDGLLPFMSFANLAILLIIVVIINRNKT